MVSFVENVNILAKNIDVIVEAKNIFDDSVLPVLQEVADLDLEDVTGDLQKGNYLGNRKIDIDLALNKIGLVAATTYESAMAIWMNTANTVYYNKATVTFVDGTQLVINFINDDLQPIQVSTHGAVIDQLNNNTAFTTKLESTAILEEVGGRTGTIIRIVDVAGHSSNVDRIQLHASAGAFVSASTIHYWALTTSALQTLANRVGDIIALGNDIDKIIVLSSSIDEMLALQNALTELMAVYANLVQVASVGTSITSVNTVATNIASVNVVNANIAEIVDVGANISLIQNAQGYATTATAQAAIAIANAATATTKATEATTAAATATAKNAEIKNVSVETTVTASAGTPASVVYNSTTGKFTFIVPEGLKGDRGESFEVNSVGLFAERSVYNAQVKGFSFLAIDTAEIYFKLSNTSGDWSVAAPFGKGETGSTGATGNGIASITRTSGDGSAGSTDTYTITFTNASTTTFNVVNGANGITQTKESIGLGNVDNTSDANKPISTLTQAALNLKANSSDMTTALALKLNKTIDNYVKQLNVTSHVYTGTDLTTTNYTGGNKVVYAYIDGNLSTEKYYDTDGTTLLLTITYGYTDGNLTSETRS